VADIHGSTLVDSELDFQLTESSLAGEISETAREKGTEFTQSDLIENSGTLGNKTLKSHASVW
jgi:hypothetical protein